MKKAKKLSLFLVALVAVIGMSLLGKTVLAEDFILNQLKSAHKNVYAGEIKGNDYSGIDTFNLYNPMNIDVDKNDDKSDFSFWHFVDTSSQSNYANITFQNENNETITWKVEPCMSNQHFAVITPSSWKLIDGISYSTASGNFNLSHSARHEATTGTVKVNAKVDPYYYEITPNLFFERTKDEYYERTKDEYYERTKDEYYERTKDEYYERTVTQNYVRPVSEIYNRYAQKYLVPTFTRKINSIEGTLVTRLTYSDNSKKAIPTNGGAFKNGHTYVAIDVQTASQNGGIWYTIADSSKNNGKKTPSQYNKPIEYKYNVSIKDNKLTVSFDDQLVNASVGAELVANTNKFSGHAPKHYQNSVTVDVPSNNGTVYLYTHIERLDWYESKDNYYFVEWINDETRTTYDEDYTLIDTKYGEYELVDTIYGDYKLVDTKYGEYELVDTIYGDYKLVDTKYGEYELVDTIYGEYELVNTTYDKKKKSAEYNSNLILTVDGEEKSLDEELELSIGKHIFTISSTGGEFEPITKEVEIEAGENEAIEFDVVYQLDDVELESIEHHNDKETTIHEKDLEATIHEKDLEATIHKSDKEATIHEKDLEPEIIYSDSENIEKIYNEEYLYHEDIKLGNETDPFGEYAIRLN